MYSYDHHLRVSCCDIHRNSVDFILRVEVRWQRNTVTPLQYFIPRVYYFFFFLCVLSLDTFSRIFLHRVAHFTLRTFYSPGICLPVTVFNVPDVETAATGKGTNILLSHAHTYLPIHRIDVQNASSSGSVLRWK